MTLLHLPPPGTTIRAEEPGDADAVRALLQGAFERDDEARLVERLHADGDVVLALVANVGRAVVGHVLYSPVSVGEGDAALVGAGLAPLAVLAAVRGQGIGAALVEAGNERLRARGCPFVAVLGDPAWYARFGFGPAARHGLRCRWEVPEGAFMLRVLDEARLAGRTGLASYRPAFDALS